MNTNKTNKFFLTEEGLIKLKKELDHYINVERPRIIKEIVQAVSNHDLKENFDNDMAKAEQGEIEQRISEIKNILANHQIIESSDIVGNNEAQIGSLVTYHEVVSKAKKQVKIVGSVEYDIFSDVLHISNKSPLAQVLMGAKVDDIRTVRNIPKPYKIKILDIVN